jgi:radical SAM protein with 4Fe4S-binding SPASM domain
VQQLAKLGIIQLTLTGGEPLLRHDLPEILRAIKSARMGVLLQTNATMVDSRMADRLHFLLDPRLAMVQASLDGATAETHERIRGAGTFQAACDGIRRLAETGLSVIVSCCPIRWNEEELPALYSLAGELGAAAFQATPLAPFSPSLDRLTPDQDMTFRAEAEIRLRAQSPGAPRYLGGVSGEDLHWISHAAARRFVPQRSVSPDRFVCGGLRTKIHIAADGAVYPCVFAAANELKLGRVTESPLKRIWELRAAHPFARGRSAEDSVCGKCAWAAVCRGGCPGLALVRRGSLDRPDPRCRYGRELEETCEPIQRKESP